MSKPIFKDTPSCPYCGKEAVMMELPNQPDVNAVTWCEDGHVCILLGRQYKKVFDFKPEDSHMGVRL